jgi:DNA-binding response OmpR family regulator
VRLLDALHASNATELRDATYRPFLYCEDDPDSRDVVTFVLSRGDYEVICTENAEEALILAKNKEFDLFLVDNWLPALSGLELARYIREFNQTTPIFFYSAAAFESDKRTALDAGAQGYVTKPTDIDEDKS